MIAEDISDDITDMMKYAIRTKHITGNKVVLAWLDDAYVDKLPEWKFKEDGSIKIIGHVRFNRSFNSRVYAGLHISEVHGGCEWFTEDQLPPTTSATRIPQYITGKCRLHHKIITQLPLICGDLQLDRVMSLRDVAFSELQQCEIGSGRLTLFKEAKHLLHVFFCPHIRQIHHPALKMAVGFGYRDPFTIVNQHLEGKRDIIACQDELIESGFIEQAQL